MARRIGEDECIGAVRCGGVWRLFAAPPSDWVLDYPEYAGEAAPAEYRKGLATVCPRDGEAFLHALSDCELDEAEVRRAVLEQGHDLMVSIDFDLGRYVNSESNIAYESYLPTGWRGEFSPAVLTLPEHLQALFRREPRRDRSR